MLKDLFSSRLFIIMLAFAVLSIGGSLLYLQHVERESAKALAETEAFAKWWKQYNATPENTSSEVPKSADGKRIDVGKTDKQGDVDKVDGTSDSVQQNDKTPDFWSLSPEQRQQIFDQFYLQYGLKVPPRGYDYDWKDVGVPYLDENGKPVLRRLDEPIIRIEMGVGFAPTLEEYEKYEQLMFDAGVAKSRGDVAEAERLKAEIKALKASAQRMRPLSVSSISTTAEQGSKSRRFAKARYNAALREHGLGHLINPWD